MKNKNYYKELGVNPKASKSEIKSAYRLLVKKYHPDKGGNKEKFLEIQSAWENLNDPIKRKLHDSELFSIEKSTDYENIKWGGDLKSEKYSSSVQDQEITKWISNIYEPINKLLNQIIKPLNKEIKDLSADPYDDNLMDQFCKYIVLSKRKIEKASNLYKSHPVPKSISTLGLDLYYCFAHVQDSLDELDRYTQGYVDDYLFDGKEMMKEAKRIQTKMSNIRKNISFS